MSRWEERITTPSGCANINVERHSSEEFTQVFDQLPAYQLAQREDDRIGLRFESEQLGRQTKRDSHVPMLPCRIGRRTIQARQALRS